MTIETNFIKVDMAKAKETAHEARRADRDAKMAPLDIKATIPAEATQAEVDRQAIRDANAATQVSIDSAKTAADLKKIMVDEGYTE